MVIRSRFRSLWRSAGVSERRLLVIFSSAAQFDTQYSFEFPTASGPSMRLLDLPPLRSELGACGFRLAEPGRQQVLLRTVLFLVSTAEWLSMPRRLRISLVAEPSMSS